MKFHLIPVAAAVVKKDGRFLLTQRQPGKMFENQWEFPGGKLEAGESPEAALERELTEELGILTRTGAILDARVSGEYLILFYESEHVSGDIIHLDVQDARFVTLDEARALPMVDKDRETMEKLFRMHRI